MSAKNWAECPRCLSEATAKKEKLKTEVVKAYGKVSPDKYLSMVIESNNPVEVESTLAEYYEIGVSESGKFIVSYSCDCRTCGWSHEFRHENQLKVEGKLP